VEGHDDNVTTVLGEDIVAYNVFSFVITAFNQNIGLDFSDYFFRRIFVKTDNPVYAGQSADRNGSSSVAPTRHTGRYGPSAGAHDRSVGLFPSSG